MERLLSEIGLSKTPSNQLYALSAVEWINTNTILKINPEAPTDLPAGVKLFISKYAELMTIHTGVSSESISGLSQSYVTGQSLESRIYELAIALLGKDKLKSTVKVFSGESAWDYGC